MLNRFYQSLESITSEESISLDDCVKHLTFNDQGLIPVVAQCYQSKEVLMQAWTNTSAIEKILAHWADNLLVAQSPSVLGER